MVQEEVRLLKVLQEHFPYIVEEMNGIAEATNLSPKIVQLIHFKPTFGKVVKEIKTSDSTLNVRKSMFGYWAEKELF